MYKILTILLLVIIGLSSATGSFKTPSANLQRLTSNIQKGNVGIDFCPLCINEAVEMINVILNVILDEGILKDCGELCSFVTNRTSKWFGDVCDVACDAVGIDEFIRLIITMDIDPIWYCEIAKLCPINDDGDAKFTNFGVYPNTGPQGTTFVIDCSFKTLNGTGTSMLRLEMDDNTDDYLIEARKPGTYPEKFALKTLTAFNCDPTKGFCDDFPVGTYNITVLLCNGGCGSHHPHSQTYDFGNTTFTVTKKK